MQLKHYFSTLIQWTRSKQVTTPSRSDKTDPELALPKPASLAIVLIANVFLQVSTHALNTIRLLTRHQIGFFFHHHPIVQ